MPADVVVKKSKIEGKGVFAARDFKKGEVVVCWDISKELSKEEAERVPDEEKRYVDFFSGKYILQSPPARYVNHSCEPNTFVKDFCDVAARDIRMGEEITADYAKCPAPGMDMRCSCGSKNCRGTIK
jgi:SET domain-containing protein